MKAGRLRRKVRAAERAARRRPTTLVQRFIDRFVDDYCRWQKLTAETHDVCPFCGALVIIQPAEGHSHYSHAMPVCPPWVPAFNALGAYNVRETQL